MPQYLIVAFSPDTVRYSIYIMVLNIVTMDFQGEVLLQIAVVRACRGQPELEQAMFSIKPTCEALFSDLRAAIQITMALPDAGAARPPLELGHYPALREGRRAGTPSTPLPTR